MVISEALIEACERYMREESDECYRRDITKLLESETESAKRELADRMLGTLVFGTAGIRAKMGPGYNRMNVVSAFRFGFGLAQVLKKSRWSLPRVVVACDARHRSPMFAHEIARVLAGLEIEVVLVDKPIPTPVAAFLTRDAKAQVGVVVTASHNPKDDNGIKVYASSSMQAPRWFLQEIEQEMAKAPPRHEHASDLRNIINLDVDTKNGFGNRYLTAITQGSLFFEREMDKQVAAVYTPLHGVGGEWFMEALKRGGFSQISMVTSQSYPCGDFPNLTSLNPEEGDSLDEAIAVAKKEGVDVVLANDPDADRLQVAIKNDQGDFERMNGNEMGILLGYFAMKKAVTLGQVPLVATSIVSSRMLKKMAKALGAHYVESLTGFGNIMASAESMSATTHTPLTFAYEEAIGFSLGDTVLDKDGISSGLRFMEIAAFLQGKKSLHSMLDELYLTYGAFFSRQWHWQFHGLEAKVMMARAMSEVRARSEKEWAAIFGYDSCAIYDLLQPQTSGAYAGLQADVVIIEVEDKCRLIFRPSGTEAKVKIYLEHHALVPSAEALDCLKREFSFRMQGEFEQLHKPEWVE